MLAPHLGPEQHDERPPVDRVRRIQQPSEHRTGPEGLEISTRHQRGGQRDRARREADRHSLRPLGSEARKRVPEQLHRPVPFDGAQRRIVVPPANVHQVGAPAHTRHLAEQDRLHRGEHGHAHGETGRQRQDHCRDVAWRLSQLPDRDPEVIEHLSCSGGAAPGRRCQSTWEDWRPQRSSQGRTIARRSPQVLRSVLAYSLSYRADVTERVFSPALPDPQCGVTEDLYAMRVS